MIAVLALIALWVLFLAYTALYANWHSLRPEVKIIGAVVVLCGFVLDVCVNWSIGLTLGITSDVTLSQKCSRLKQTLGWRSAVAHYLCRAWLDPFQVGGHCK